MAASATYALSYVGYMFGNNNLPVVEHSVAWVDSASAGEIPDCEIPTRNTSGGVITGIKAKFDETTVADSLTVTITDSHGIEIYEGTITASGVFTLDQNITYTGLLTVSHSGNTTPNAPGTTYILVA